MTCWDSSILFWNFWLLSFRYRIIAIESSSYRYRTIASSRYRFIALSLHRAIIPSSSRYRTIASWSSRHRHCIFALSHYRPQPRWCDGAIVNCVVLSGFQTKPNKITRNLSYLEHGPSLPVARLSVLANISKTNIPVCASFNILTTNIFDLSDIFCSLKQ